MFAKVWVLTKKYEEYVFSWSYKPVGMSFDYHKLSRWVYFKLKLSNLN